MTMRSEIRARIYDLAIVKMTSAWYREALRRLPDDARVLDVGIGTGGALLANSSLIRAKRLSITGVDIDSDYIRRCRSAVAREGLTDQIRVVVESVYDHRGGPYDRVYFSGSFMLLPDPVGALRHCRTLLAPGGAFLFTQTFEHARAPLLEIIKPLLRFVTSIDFGRVTYEPELRRTLEAGGLKIDEVAWLEERRKRGACLIVARPM